MHGPPPTFGRIGERPDVHTLMHMGQSREQVCAGPAPNDVHAAQLGTAVVVLLLAASTLLGDVGGGEPTRILVLDGAVALVSAVAAPLLVRRPIHGAVALMLLSVISPAGTPGASVAALHLGWRRPLPQAVAVACIGGAAHLVRWVWRPYPGISFGWWAFFVCVAAAALVGWGTLLRARGALIDSLRERAARAEAEQGRRVAEARAQERAAIAREMHDVLAHRLSLLATYAGALEYRPDASPERLAEAAGVIRSGVHDALDDLRDVISVLRDDRGVDPAAADHPQPDLADLPTLVAESSNAGMEVTLDDETPQAPGGTVARTAYRIVQEALTNARKHAPGQPVRVLITGSAGNELTIQVANPVPADAASGLPGSGTGLVGLTERARLLGGRLDHRLTADHRFVLTARLPWPL